MALNESLYDPKDVIKEAKDAYVFAKRIGKEKLGLASPTSESDMVYE